MEKFKDIKQFDECKKFCTIYGEKYTPYTFLMITPSNPSYIYALNELTKEAERMYIPLLTDDRVGKRVFVGETDWKVVYETQMEYHTSCINYLLKKIAACKK